MPRHHGPPDVAGPLDTETEQIKRPKKRGSGTRRTRSRQHLHLSEIAPHELPAPTAHPSPPEPLAPPALSPPSSTSGTPSPHLPSPPNDLHSAPTPPPALVHASPLPAGT